MALALERGPVNLDVDLLPDRPPDDLAAELTSVEHRAARRGIRSLLDAWLPNRLVPALLAHAHLTVPGPTTFVVPIEIQKVHDGRYGFKTVAKIPKIGELSIQ